MRVSQKERLLKVKQALSEHRSELLLIRAEVAMNGLVSEGGLSERIESAIIHLEESVSIIRSLVKPDNPPQTREKNNNEKH